MIMGRHPSCQIVLDNAAVSRNHAQILESHGTYYLEDLRSRNGTLLNGKKISGRAEVRDKDEIRVCEVVLQFFEKLPADADEESIVVTTPTALGELKPGEDRQVTVSETDLAGMGITGAFAEKQMDDLSSDSSSIITSLDVTNRSP